MAKKKAYDEEDEAESEEQAIGPCRDCQYYDVDREDDEEVGDDTIAGCLHPDLEEYQLRVSGDSGCNLFEPYSEDYDDEEEDEEEEEDDEEEY